MDCNNPTYPRTTSLLVFDRLVSLDHQTPEKRQLAFAISSYSSSSQKITKMPRKLTVASTTSNLRQVMLNEMHWLISHIQDFKGANIDNAKVVPKKRGAASTNEAADEATPTKKRTAVKDKAVTNGDAAANEGAKGNADESVAPKTPTSRKKAVSKSASAEDHGDHGDTEMADSATSSSIRVSPKKTPGKAKFNGRNDEEGDEDPVTPPKSNGVTGTNVRGTPRKRQAPKESIAKPRGIPESYEEADQADRMMCVMKEEQKASWDDIRKMWKTMTGQDTAAR